MSNLPNHAVAVRLDVGFLGVEHREALRKLPLITARTIESDAVLNRHPESRPWPAGGISSFKV